MSHAQSVANNYFWPIKRTAGENIICASQRYIDNEFNFDGLYIGAGEGTTVLAPTDSTVTYFSVGYLQTLNQSIPFKLDKPNFDEKIKDIKPHLDRTYNSEYLCGMIIGIRGQKWF